MAAVKLATGTLTLQEHKAKFARKGEVSSLCPMCRKETENTAHFILQCASLQEVRKPFMDKVFCVIVAGTVYNINLWIRYLNSSFPLVV
jgi:hypothetical protein